MSILVVQQAQHLQEIGGQWFNEALGFLSISVLADSFRLRNRQLRVAAKGYEQLNQINEKNINFTIFTFQPIVPCTM